MIEALSLVMIRGLKPTALPAPLLSTLTSQGTLCRHRPLLTARDKLADARLGLVQIATIFELNIVFIPLYPVFKDNDFPCSLQREAPPRLKQATEALTTRC